MVVVVTLLPISKANTDAERVPDCTVTKNGLAPVVPSNSIVILPYESEEVNSLFQTSKITSLSVAEVSNAGFLSQNSTVVPVSKLDLRFDSLVPFP